MGDLRDAGGNPNQIRFGQIRRVLGGDRCRPEKSIGFTDLMFWIPSDSPWWSIFEHHLGLRLTVLEPIRERPGLHDGFRVRLENGELRIFVTGWLEDCTVPVSHEGPQELPEPRVCHTDGPDNLSTGGDAS